jgi:hypothetical protein
MNVAGQIRNGKPDVEAVEYILWVQTVQMGVRTAPTQIDRRRATETVQAIKAYVATLD